MKETRLYNVMFPIWILWLFPLTWIVVLPANFIIDLLVVVLAMKYWKMTDIKVKAKKVIFRVWIMGFVADIIGSLFMFVGNLIDLGNDWIYDKIVAPLCTNPFESIWALLWATACTALTGFLIYQFNKSWCLKKADLTEEERKKVAMALAIFTAPYLFYLPTIWFYN